MNAVKRTCALTLALGALGAGCGSDGGSNDGDLLDASASVLDASLKDAGTGDASTYPCTSYYPAKAPLCGGSHCLQTPEKLRSDTPTSAVCGQDVEVTKFCSLESVNIVGNCAVAAAVGTGPDTKTCATPQLPGFSTACIDCYVASADCARNKCFDKCLSRETPTCDECRVREGCIEEFYKCSGFVNPLPPEYRPSNP